MFCTTSETEGEVVHVKLVKAPSNSLLTVPRRYFCCGFMFFVFGVRVLMTFHLTCVHIILVWFWLLSGHLLGNRCSLGWPYVLFCILTICNISYFPFLF